MKHDLGGGLALFHPERKKACIGHLAFTAGRDPYSMIIFLPASVQLLWMPLPVSKPGHSQISDFSQTRWVQHTWEAQMMIFSLFSFSEFRFIFPVYSSFYLSEQTCRGIENIHRNRNVISQWEMTKKPDIEPHTELPQTIHLPTNQEHLLH